MRVLLTGFADELVKLARIGTLIPYQSADPMVEIVKQKALEEPHKDYVRSALVGAALAPIASIASKGIGRFMRNKAILGAMKRAPDQAAELQKELVRGPLVGSFRPGGPTVQPVATYDQLGSDAIMGALGGSAFEALKKTLEGNNK